MILRATVIVIAVVASLVELPPRWVEHSYAQGIYAALQPVLTSASNHVPIALLDVLIVTSLLLFIVGVVRAFEETARRRSWKPLAALGVNLVTAAAVVYLAFLGLWGLNYERQSLADRLAFDRAAARSERVVQLAAESVHEMNDLYETAHAKAFPEWNALPDLMHDSYVEIQSRLTPGITPVPGVPKRSVLGFYFERAGVSGMTDPFFLETLVDRNLLPFERPFVAAHEWAHLAGYADEGEANFVGWLTCVNSQPFARYSGWLYLYAQAAGAVPSAQRSALIKALKSGPRADLQAIAERLRRIEPHVQAVSWRVYDRYLKANGVPQGVASYDKALQLILGAQFVDRWHPVLKPKTVPLETLPAR